MIRFFTFQVSWYNDWDDKDEISQGIVAATDFNDAVAKMVKRFPNIGTFTITEILDDTDFIFLDEPTYATVMNDFDAWCEEEEDEDGTGYGTVQDEEVW